jgi:lipopolysaccharide export system protein LptA
MTTRIASQVRVHRLFRSPASCWCAALCLLLCCAHPAFAEKADREKKIDFQGDTGGGNAETKTGELTGHVIITQGTMTIQADRVTFKQNADNSLSAIAYGNPVRFREKRDGADDYYEGYAQRIAYDGEKRFIELFDNALLKKTGDEIRSNYITYSAATEKFTAEGRPDAKPPGPGDAPLGARVRGTFQPKNDEKAEKPAPKDKDAAKDSPPKDKDAAAKDSAPKDSSATAADSSKDKNKAAVAKTTPALTLQPSGDLAPAK